MERPIPEYGVERVPPRLGRRVLVAGLVVGGTVAFLILVGVAAFRPVAVVPGTPAPVPAGRPSTRPAAAVGRHLRVSVADPEVIGFGGVAVGHLMPRATYENVSDVPVWVVGWSPSSPVYTTDATHGRSRVG